MAETNASFDGTNGRRAPSDFLTDEAKQASDALKAKASEIADAAQYEVDEIGTAAKEIVVDATDRMKSAANEHKTATADYLATVSQAIQRAAGEFEKDVPQAAQYIRRAGSQLGNVATVVRERDTREIVAEVEDFARRQPALFFGGALFLGFAALRFLKSSTPMSVQGKAQIQAR